MSSESASAIDGWLLPRLACPKDGGALTLSGDTLCCAEGHEYWVADGVPVLLPPDIEPTISVALETLEMAAQRRLLARAEVETVHPYVQRSVAATNSNLYRHMVGRLSSYPIPDLPLPNSDGGAFLDIGSNWGRWCIAAARRGYIPVGVDPCLEALLAAQSVARQCGVRAYFVAADSRYLPFRDGSFDAAYSYSVFQHLSKENARLSIGEIGRTLKAGGVAKVQLLNSFGARSIQVQAMRGFRLAIGFETRYWRPSEMRRVFTDAIGPSRLQMDSFFTQGRQTDRALFRAGGRLLVSLSNFLMRMKWLWPVCDNLFVCARKPKLPDADGGKGAAPS